MKVHSIPRLPAKARPEHNYFWKGGRTVTVAGYVYVKTWGHPHATKIGYVMEHRLVMEKKLGRYLKPKEAVHHLDGNPLNNDPANLALFVTNGRHLAATLQGHRHNLSSEGRAILRRPKSPETREKMRRSLLRFWRRKRGSSPSL